MFDKVWLKDTLERVVKTFIQVFVGALLVSIPDAESLDWAGFITWQRAALMGAVAAVLSVLTSALSAPKTNTLSPASAVSPPHHG